MSTVRKRKWTITRRGWIGLGSGLALVAIGITLLITKGGIEPWLTIIGAVVPITDAVTQTHHVDVDIADAQRLADEAAVCLYIRDWPSNHSPDQVLETVRGVFNHPVLMKQKKASSALRAAERQVESTPTSIAQAIAVQQQLLDVMPSPQDYLSALVVLPPGVAIEKLRRGYNVKSSKGDYLAWTYLVLLKEWGEYDVLKPILADRLIKIPDHHEAFDATYAMAERIIGSNEFPLWLDEVRARAEED